MLAEDGRREDRGLAHAVEAERGADGADGALDRVRRVDDHAQVAELRVVEHVLHLEHGRVRHVGGDELF
ncbi:MAG TPA: hypothetical protein VK817_21320 [Trebonia sp.]|nr:hypothetical protein [Trebonia sp.]